MAAYKALKKLKLEKDYSPGEIIILDEKTQKKSIDILVRTNFIQPVVIVRHFEDISLIKEELESLETLGYLDIEIHGIGYTITPKTKIKNKAARIENKAGQNEGVTNIPEAKIEQQEIDKNEDILNKLPQCVAKNKSGEQCKNPATHGVYCELHSKMYGDQV